MLDSHHEKRWNVASPAGVPFPGGSLETEWMDGDVAKSVLRNTYVQWANDAPAVDLSALAALRYEVWAAESSRQTIPAVCAAAFSAPNGQRVVAGLLCGYARHAHRDFFIQQVALHPTCVNLPALAEEIGRKLLEAAMDVSVALGYFGWVSCSPEADGVPFWQSLGFSRSDEFTYRRMGYFH